MNGHVEWADTGDMLSRIGAIQPLSIGAFRDSYGTVNTKPVMVLDNGSGLIAIEGSVLELIALGDRIKTLAMTIPPEELHGDLREAKAHRADEVADGAEYSARTESI